MLQEAVLKKHFVLKSRKGWTSLETRNAELSRSFRTRRIAKIVDGHRFLFTIGETQQGKDRDRELSATLEQIVRQAGLAVLSEPTTNGRLRNLKLYRGFDLAGCSPETLERILEQAEDAIIKCR